MIEAARHDNAASPANVAHSGRRTNRAVLNNHSESDHWIVGESKSTSERELSWAYDARLFDLRKRNEALQRDVGLLLDPK